jgi:hypothetical protein
VATDVSARAKRRTATTTERTRSEAMVAVCFPLPPVTPVSIFASGGR